MDKLPFPALLAAVLLTGIYAWLRQCPMQEIAGMFIVSAVLLSGLYYLGKWALRHRTPKPQAAPDHHA